MSAPVRKQVGVRVSQPAYRILRQACKRYGCSQSQLIEAILTSPDFTHTAATALSALHDAQAQRVRALATDHDTSQGGFEGVDEEATAAKTNPPLPPITGTIDDWIAQAKASTNTGGYPTT